MGVVPEYALAARRYFGEEQGAAWVAGMQDIPEMERVTIRPEWAAILDFETRFPSAMS